MIDLSLKGLTEVSLTEYMYAQFFQYSLHTQQNIAAYCAKYMYPILYEW